MWFYSKSLALMVVSLVSFLLLFLLENMVVVCYDVNSFIEMSFNLTFLIDDQSLLFVSTVSMVSSVIVIYSYFYMSEESDYSKKKFLMILLIFIVSMFILSVSANIYCMMIGWDGLGISSFCLIIFYQNWKSFSSGMVTFMSNRFGDSLIIISMVIIVINGSLSSWTLVESVLISLVLFLGAYSKSAQLPYLFWLPQAMAAPTPVSALVHSSTLVTAGIYTVCRYISVLSSKIAVFMYIVSCITMLLAGTSSLMEFDLKKVIALSTLCHISLMMMLSVLGELYLAFFHLMMHAFFKSLLFMVAGYMIHMNLNFQDIRWMSELNMNLYVSFPFFVSIFSMMGFPFMSGYYSKESIYMGLSFSISSVLGMVTFLVSSFFSCAYSFRLVVYLFKDYGKKMVILSNNSMASVLMFSSLLSSFSGGVVVWLFFGESEVVQPGWFKFMLLLFSLMGVLVGMNADKFKLNFFLKSSLVQLWKSDYLYKIFQKQFFLLSYVMMWRIDEKGVVKELTEKLIDSANKFLTTSSELFIKEPFIVIKLFHIVAIVLLMWGN